MTSPDTHDTAQWQGAEPEPDADTLPATDSEDGTQDQEPDTGNTDAGPTVEELQAQLDEARGELAQRDKTAAINAAGFRPEAGAIAGEILADASPEQIEPTLELLAKFAEAAKTPGPMSNIPVEQMGDYMSHMRNGSGRTGNITHESSWGSELKQGSYPTTFIAK